MSEASESGPDSGYLSPHSQSRSSPQHPGGPRSPYNVPWTSETLREEDEEDEESDEEPLEDESMRSEQSVVTLSG